MMKRSSEVYGLIYQNKWPSESVPLEQFNVHAVIVNNNADVFCEFSYKNTSSEIIETAFVFPMESTAAVYFLEAIIGEKRLTANCRERIEAESTYSEAVEAGHTVFMMQEDYTMGDTFKMLLGNIPAGETIKITFKYAVPLYLREVDKTIVRFAALQESSVFIFSMPSRIGERYDSAPGTHDLSMSSKLATKMSFAADIYADGGIFSVTSAHQKFSVEFLDATQNHAKVSLLNDLDSSYDFELELAVKDLHVFCAPCELGWSSGDTFLDMHCIAATFLPIIPQQHVNDGDKREIIFVLDRSGSMAGSRIQKTKEALLLFLKSLPKKCRFQIIGFGSTFNALFHEPVDYTKDNLALALQYQANLNADMGGTEVFAALKSVYDTPVTGSGWYRQIIFLTDGDICNQDQVIGLIKRNQSTARLFAIGLGDEVSTSLINGVARAGRGTAAFIRNTDNLRVTTMSILRSALQPMLTDVSLNWDVTVDAKSPEILTVPSQLPPLFSGVFMTAFGLLQAGDSESPRIEGTLTLSYKLEEEVHSQSVAVNYLPVQKKSLGLHILAAKAQISELVDQHSALSNRTDDNADDGAKAEVYQQIVDLSTSTNVISPFTSFIGVDPDKIDNFSKPPTRHRMVPRCAMASAVPSPLLFAGVPDVVDCCQAFRSQPLSSSNTFGCVSSRKKTGGFLGHTSSAISAESATAAIEDVVVLAAVLQDFDGFWCLNKELAKLLNITHAQLSSSKPSDVDDSRYWATALVIAYLQIYTAARQEEWEIIAKKAMDWLEEHYTNTKLLIDNAKKALEKLGLKPL